MALEDFRRLECATADIAGGRTFRPVGAVWFSPEGRAVRYFRPETESQRRKI